MVYSDAMNKSERQGKNMGTCSNGIIPEHYHTYYKNLKTDRKARDKLPMPDAEESDCETDDN